MTTEREKERTDTLGRTGAARGNGTVNVVEDVMVAETIDLHAETEATETTENLSTTAEEVVAEEATVMADLAANLASRQEARVLQRSPRSLRQI